jgi:O-antigen/teichoic acid export membrane protein
LDAFKKLLRWLEVDRAVMFAVLSKVWSIFAAPITLLLIAHFLAPEVQGFYYTFLSLIALQSFVGLGFYIVITQFASHEWASLSLDSAGFISGDEKARLRLISLGRLVFKWYAWASAIFVLLVGAGGYLFLSQSPDPGISWKGPWFSLMVVAGLQFWALPFLSLLEGCNQVHTVYRFRFVQGIVSSLAIWLTLFLDFELWMAVAGLGTGLLCSLYLLLVFYKNFFQPFFIIKPKEGIHWKEEIWPMQWRLALGGSMGYFMVSIYTPVMFHYHGPVVAGQMGMTWQLVAALGSLAMAWVATKVPRFGILVAQKNYSELDRFFFRTSGISMGVISLGAVLLWLLVYGLNYFEHPLAQRLLSPLPFGLFIVGTVLGQIAQCQSAYLRAHKKEPFLLYSFVYGLLNGIVVWFFGSRFGAIGASVGYLSVMLLVSVPLGSYIWVTCRRKWHADYSEA